MTQYQTHAQDCVEILKEQHRAGRLSRRQVLAGATALGLLPLAGHQAQAQSGELVIANWGGDAVAHFGSAFGPAVEKELGLKVVIDGGGPSMGRIRTMVDANNTIWDVCNWALATRSSLAGSGWLNRSTTASLTARGW